MKNRIATSKAMKAAKQPITLEANEIVNGPRRDAYGDATGSFKAIGFKMLRESNSHHRDNLVDIAGYAQLANDCAEAK